jgi:hypothetical protein
MSIQNEVFLEPVSHTYSNLSGRKFTSVSKVLESVSEKVDWSAIAGKVAGKGKFAGMTKEDILLAWDKNRDKAANHGTRIHNALERYSKEFKILSEDEDLTPMIKSIASTYVDYYQTFDEACLFSDQYGVAGTADKILQIKKGSPFVDIEDFKTNISKGIEFFNKDNKYLISPVSHLQDCNFNKYSLQLSIYGLMYETLTGGKVRNLWIRFIPADNPMGHYRIMIPYLRLEALAVLEYHKNTFGESNSNILIKESTENRI